MGTIDNTTATDSDDALASVGCILLCSMLSSAAVPDELSGGTSPTLSMVGTVVQRQLLATYGLQPVLAPQSTAMFAVAPAVTATAVDAPATATSSVPLHPRVTDTTQPRRVGELGVKYYDVNEGFADTYGGYGKFIYAPASGKDLWTGEVAYLDRFDDDGTYFSIANTHAFTDLYYTSIALGTSAGGFFWPSFRVDASLSRKWLPRRNFVSTVGVTYVDAKDEHTDASILLEGTYYFDTPWILQGGVRVNQSDPGSVTSPSGYVAATHGRDRQRFVTLRYGFGYQGYEALTAPAFVVDFSFNELTLTWREWVTPDAGFNLVGYGFQSEPYDQIGVELGVFKEF